jgi:hypothetical protein
MKPYAGGKDGCLQHLCEQSFPTARCATITTAGGETVRLAWAWLWRVVRSCGITTGVVPVRCAEVAHELHVKFMGLPTKSGMLMLLKPRDATPDPPKHLEHDGHVSVEGCAALHSFPPSPLLLRLFRPRSCSLLAGKCAVGNRTRTGPLPVEVRPFVSNRTEPLVPRHGTTVHSKSDRAASGELVPANGSWSRPSNWAVVP